jgi:hypothetical protein
VTPRGVPDGDMPDRPQPTFWGYPPSGDGEDLDAWLAGYTMVTSPAVDDALTALLAPPSRAELVGEPAALAEFRRVNGHRPHQAPARTRRPDRRLVPSLMWLGAAAALVVVGVFGAATVTGRLPNPIQDIAHVVFASHSSSAPASPAHKASHPQTSSVGATRLPAPAGTPNGGHAAPHPRQAPPSVPANHAAAHKTPPGWFRNRQPHTSITVPRQPSDPNIGASTAGSLPGR